jgi:hypothetical protein
MKPAWDKLMKNWNKGDRVKTSLIADVDCTGEGKPLCEQVGVEGFPTIKWGDVTNLEKYEGGRDYDAMKKFAKENLKPMCSPVNLDLCSEEMKAEIGKFQAMPAEELSAAIEEKKAKIKEAEDHFTAELNKLQEQLKEFEEEKKAKIAAVKDSGLGIMQAVASAAGKKGKEEL